MRMHAIGLLFSLSAAVPLHAARVENLPQPAEGTLPNSETATNLVFAADLGRLEKITFSLALDANASNSLSIAVGSAAEESLALEEADFTWGFDCGKWFYADTATGVVEEWPAEGTGRAERTLTIDKSDFNPQWNRIRIVKRGLGDIHAEAVRVDEFKRFSVIVR